ncbi:MAG: hypothetical protein KatS3mg061_1886 [Dehalococcoidia bacterium]|nr:MAG: hypothetical protein KatS3mg061_1886 [Dehalococcoidia bacterium]
MGQLPTGRLSGVRVVDLVDLGADVVRIEPPSGDPLRRRGPFFRDQPGQSLTFAFYNTGKRSLPLGLTTSARQETLRS